MASFANRARGLALREDFRQQAGDMGELNRMQPAQTSTQPDGWEMGRTLRGNQNKLDNVRGQAILDENLDRSLRDWAKMGLERRGQQFDQDMATKKYNQGIRAYEEGPKRAQEFAGFQSNLANQNFKDRFGMQQQGAKDIAQFQFDLNEKAKQKERNNQFIDSLLFGGRPGSGSSSRTGGIMGIGGKSKGFGFEKGQEPTEEDAALFAAKLQRAGYDMEGIDPKLIMGALREGYRTGNMDGVVGEIFGDRNMKDPNTVLAKLKGMDRESPEFAKLAESYVQMAKSAPGDRVKDFAPGLEFLTADRSIWRNDPGYSDEAKVAYSEMQKKKKDVAQREFDSRKDALIQAFGSGDKQRIDQARMFLDEAKRNGAEFNEDEITSGVGSSLNPYSDKFANQGMRDWSKNAIQGSELGRPIAASEIASGKLYNREQSNAELEQQVSDNQSGLRMSPAISQDELAAFRADVMRRRGRPVKETIKQPVAPNSTYGTSDEEKLRRINNAVRSVDQNVLDPAYRAVSKTRSTIENTASGLSDMADRAKISELYGSPTPSEQTRRTGSPDIVQVPESEGSISAPVERAAPRFTEKTAPTEEERLRALGFEKTDAPRTVKNPDGSERTIESGTTTNIGLGNNADKAARERIQSQTTELQKMQDRLTGLRRAGRGNTANAQRLAKNIETQRGILMKNEAKAGEREARMALGKLDRKSPDFEKQMSSVFANQNEAGKAWLLKKFPDFDFKEGQWVAATK